MVCFRKSAVDCLAIVNLLQFFTLANNYRTYNKLSTNFVILPISSSSWRIFLSTTRSIASFQT